MQGYIQVYCGNGKGKTTAALGLALRAAGAGKKVFFAQFIKGKKYSEFKALQKLISNITLKQYGRGCFIVNLPTDEDIAAVRNGLFDVISILKTGKYDIVILDEANIAVYYDLFSVDDLIEAILNKKNNTEIIITGRYAHEKLIEIADIVTEMKEIKHYYNKGVIARKGIEY
jgi:cob(I)alamin adenosyltransferase